MRKFIVFVILSVWGITVSAQLVYKDVAGIFYSRCTNCHRPNGGAPFSLLTYSETAPWASLIQNALQTGKMPPWMPDTTYSRFLHERIITATEKNAILSWISSGTQAGDTTLAPPPPVYTSQYKLKGTPDLIVKIPAFPSNANTSDAYNCFSIPTGLTQDRWVRAFEIVPNNPSLVHHVVVKVDSMGTTVSNTSGHCIAQPGDFDLDVWAIGGQPTVFPGQAPLKTGIRLKAGSNLNLQVHYPPGTAGMIDSTQMRIYFYPPNTTGIRPIYVSTPLQNWNMFIFPNTTPTYNAQYPSNGGLPVALSLFGTFPHSHLLCKTIENWADQGTTKIPLIKINNWDFKWQGFYTFPKLVKIPAGYTLRAAHMYDNTTNNPNNPHNPPQLVTAGEGTTDEMLFDSFQWLYYLPGDENIDIGSLLVNDTLWNNPVTSAGSPELFYETTTFVYPNPFNTTTSVFAPNFDFFSVEKPMLKIFDIFGSEVHSQFLRSENEILHLELSAGVYAYTITQEKIIAGGKMVVVGK